MKLKRILLFAGVGHNIRKPKPRNLSKILKPRKSKYVIKRETVREKLRINNKHDFSTAYTPVSSKKPRLPLNEETSKKRKFFKPTVEEYELKKVRVDEPTLAREFDYSGDADKEPFEEDVSSIIHRKNWFDDEDSLKHQITRKEADENFSKEPVVRLSYITFPNTTDIITNNFKSPSPTLAHVDESVAIGNDDNLNDLFADKEHETFNKTRKYSNAYRNKSPVVRLFDIAHTTDVNKYFSVFISAMSPDSKNTISDVTNKITKSTNNLIKAASPNDQYQIDAGQKIIGPKECEKCEMVYDIGDPVDEERHRKYHKNSDNLKYKGLKTKDIVGYCGTDCIVLIRDTDPTYKVKKLQSVLKVTEDEMGCSYTVRSCWKAFLYVRNDKILGCLLAEPNDAANRVIQSDGILILSERSYTAKCGVNRIWVRSDYRRQNIATELMNCLRKNYMYGEYLQIDDVAFSDTTPDGHKFANKYTGRNDYLMYSDTNLKANLYT